MFAVIYDDTGFKIGPSRHEHGFWLLFSLGYSPREYERVFIEFTAEWAVRNTSNLKWISFVRQSRKRSVLICVNLFFFLSFVFPTLYSVTQSTLILQIEWDLFSKRWTLYCHSVLLVPSFVHTAFVVNDLQTKGLLCFSDRTHRIQWRHFPKIVTFINADFCVFYFSHYSIEPCTTNRGRTQRFGDSLPFVYRECTIVIR